MRNKISLTLIGFLANFIMAGFASQFGMLLEAAAKALNTDITQTASIFSLLNAGALAGTVIGFFVIDIIGVKRITLISYAIVTIFSIVVFMTSSLWVVNVAITIIGLFGGIGLCIAGTIIVSVWHKKIQSTMLILQDATFNFAGVVFPLIATYSLIHGLSWSFSYLIDGLFALIMVIIVIFTSFDSVKAHHIEDGEPQKSEWNLGILSSGLCIFLAMLALYTFLTWAPLFVNQKFHIPFESAGDIITEYWAASLIGAIVSAVIVTKMKVQYFFIMIMTLGMCITFFIVTTNNLNYIGYFTYGYGFVCAALYNTSIAYGVTFVKRASSKNVSFILISGSSGAMFGPAISSIFQKYLGTQIIMNSIPVLYLLIVLLVITSIYIFSRQKKAEI